MALMMVLNSLLFLVNLAARLGRAVNTCNAANRNQF
jgi:hypothetical protein